MRCGFISSHRGVYPIGTMCGLLDVNRETYYAVMRGERNLRKQKKEETDLRVKMSFEKSRKTYGSVRVGKDLGIDPKTARKSMRRQNLWPKGRKRYRVTTDSKHGYLVAENLVNRDFSPDKPGKLWLSDITYVPTSEGFRYYTVIVDMFDKKVVADRFSAPLKAADTVLPAIRAAMVNRKTEPDLVFHSDRGVQYACNETVNLLESYGVTRSMSRKGNCWDNAPAESFFKTLKAELFYGEKLLGAKETGMKIFDYVHTFYNRKRRHSALKYDSIDEFWNQLLKIKKVA